MRKVGKKTALFAILVLAFSLCVFVACGGNGGTNGGTTGGTVEENIPPAATVEVGEDFDFSSAAVMENRQIQLPSSVKVTFGEGEEVTVGNGKFTVAKVGKYTVEYTFALSKKTIGRTTEVTGVDTTAPSIIGGDDLPIRLEYGVTYDAFAFTAYDLCDGTLAPEVKLYSDDEDKTPIEVTDGKFTVNDYNDVLVEVAVSDASGNAETENYRVGVRGVHEIDFMNVRSYTENNLTVIGYDLNVSYNDDAEYAVDGGGSLRMSVKGWNPRMLLSSVNDVVNTVGKDKITQFTFWVYNDADFDCEVQFAQFDEQNNPEKAIKSIARGKQWSKVTVPVKDENAGWEIDAAKNYGIYVNAQAYEQYYTFDLYFDFFRITLKSDVPSTFSLDLKDVDQKLPADKTVTVAAADALAGLDKTKLIVTAASDKGVLVPVTEKDGSYVVSPEAAGIYTVSYLYRNGDDIEVVNQKVVLRNALADNCLESFERDYTSIITAIHKNSDATVTTEISSEKAYGGDKSLKIYQHKYGCAVLDLSTDLLGEIKNTSTLRMKILVTQSREQNGKVVPAKINFRSYNDPGEGAAWDAYLGGTIASAIINASDNDWQEITVTGDNLQTVKNSGKIVLFVEPQDWGNTTYYIDDIELTEAPSGVTLSFDDIRVAYKADQKIVIAEIDSAKWENYAVSIKDSNGNGVEYRYEGGKLGFVPSGYGEYTVRYVYREDGHKVATAEQTITVYEPLADPNFDGFEQRESARIVGTGGNMDRESFGVADSGEDGITAHSGSKMYRIKNHWKDRWLMLRLSDEMINELQLNDVISMWFRVPYQTTNSSNAYIQCTLGQYLNGVYSEINGNAISGCWQNSDNVYNFLGANGDWFKYEYRISSTEILDKLKSEKLFAIIINEWEIAGDIDVYIDDIEVTRQKSGVTMAPDTAKVLTDASGVVSSAEIADLSDSDKFAGVSAGTITVSVTGGCTVSLSGNKVVLSATATGAFTVTYTYTEIGADGHFVNTATQTVTVVNPYHDGFENGDTYIKVLGAMKDSVLLNNSDAWGSQFGESEYKHFVGINHAELSGTGSAGDVMVLIQHTYRWRSVLFGLGEDMKSILKVGDTVSFNVAIYDDNLDQNSKLQTYIWQKSDDTYTQTSTGVIVQTSGKGKTWFTVSITLGTEDDVNALKNGAIGVSFNNEVEGNYDLYFDEFRVAREQ